MENKTTTELIDLVTKLVDKDGHLKDGWEEADEELKSRSPFNEIFGIEGIMERLETLEKEVKKLKRHKHDERTGDVMIRI